MLQLVKQLDFCYKLTSYVTLFYELAVIIVIIFTVFNIICIYVFFGSFINYTDPYNNSVCWQIHTPS